MIFPTKLSSFPVPYSSFWHLHRAKTFPYLEAGLHHISISYAKSLPEIIPKKMKRILPHIFFTASYCSRPTRRGNGKSGNSDSCWNFPPSLSKPNLSLNWRKLSSPKPKIFPEKGEFSSCQWIAVISNFLWLNSVTNKHLEKK